MPRIFDNIDNALLPELSKVLSVSVRADFCVGYFNLRGWRKIDEHIEGWSGQNGNSCRLLVGMHKSPEKGLREKLATAFHDDGIDNARALELKKELAEEFRAQLALGAPSNDDEAGLRRLARQIRGGKVTVKLFLKHHLHAELYLLHRSDPINPKVGFVGSSNLTFAGLSLQGELNVDVMDHDACDKLALWFEDRWNDRWCIDISEELATIIEESWAGEKLVEPYHVYLKMRYLRMCPFESGQGHHPPTRAKTAPELGLGSCLSGVKCTERASTRTCEMTAERLSCWPPESRTGFGHRHKHINENRS